jgi:hypothetical protein
VSRPDANAFSQAVEQGPGWSFSSVTKPSTGTELYMTTLPTTRSPASDARIVACRELSLVPQAGPKKGSELVVSDPN